MTGEEIDIPLESASLAAFGMGRHDEGAVVVKKVNDGIITIEAGLGAGQRRIYRIDLNRRQLDE